MSEGQEMILIIEPSGRQYRRPKINKENIIYDLTVRGIVKTTKIIDEAAERKMKELSEKFKQLNQTAEKQVVKTINFDADNSGNTKQLAQKSGGKPRGRKVKSDS